MTVHADDGAWSPKPATTHARSPLVADVETVRTFTSRLFVYADPNSFLALRAFHDNGKRDEKAIFKHGVRIGTEHLAEEVALRIAEAANYPTPAVFCSPLATFKEAEGAKTTDLDNGLTLSVECDGPWLQPARTDKEPPVRRGLKPSVALERLSAVLGPPTLVVASGGECTDPKTGEVEPKLHLHWRLTEPTRDKADHELLYTARLRATRLVDADATGVPVVHPYRWAGSVHRKTALSKLVRIVSTADTEVDLADALDRLKAALPSGDAAETAHRARPRGENGSKLAAEHVVDVAAALAVIPNGDLPWPEWNRVGMAAFTATGGCEEGFEAFDAWSRKSAKYDPDVTRARWDHYPVSPPNSIGAGTLFYLAAEAVPGWRKPSDARASRNDPPSGGEQAAHRTHARQPSASPGECLPLFPPLPPAAPYPVEPLGPLARVAEAIAAKVQVPPAMAAQSVLATASLAAQAHADVMLPFGQPRPLSVFLVTVAGSGDRKTSSDNEALWPVRKREKALAEKRDEDLKTYRIDRAVWEAERRRIETEKKLDSEGRREALRSLGDEPELPLHAFLTAAEPTVEGLIKNWPNAHPALGILTAEGGQFTGGHSMSDESRLRSAAALCGLWDGMPITRVRAGDGVSRLPGRRLAMHLMLQPDAATEFLSHPVLRNQGLLSRMLVAAPESLIGSRPYRDASPEEDEAIRAYGARILAILEARPRMAEDKRNELDPRPLPFSADAARLWQTFHNHVEEQLGPGSPLRPMSDLAAKAAEHAARIAGVLTLVADLGAEEIGERAMGDGAELVSWYLGEALRMQAAGRTDPGLVQAKALLDWLQGRADERGEVAFRDALQSGPGTLRTKAALETALKVLADHGWTEQTSARPRRIRVWSGPGEAER